MKTIHAVCISLLVSIAFFKPSLALAQEDTAGIDDVILLEKSDISDETVLAFLKYRNLDFVLDAVAQEQLRSNGVSEKIISYLQRRDVSLMIVTPAYVVATGYHSSLPSYYFGARFVGATVYPLSWYQHHYSPLGVASVYRSTTHFDQFVNDDHSGGSALGDSIHAPRIHDEHRRIDHHATSPGHHNGVHHIFSGEH